MTQKEKTGDSKVESAFIKGGTLIHLLKIGSVKPPVSGIAENELLKIKLEVDIDPPPEAEYEVKYLLTPIPFHVRLFSQGSLFAGKLHALLCRNWKSGRMKGRDLYDYVWYLSRAVAVNITHLEARMKQTNHIKSGIHLSSEYLRDLLRERFLSINYEQAKQDIMPFIKDPLTVEIWSADFFTAITEEKLILES